MSNENLKNEELRTKIEILNKELLNKEETKNLNFDVNLINENPGKIKLALEDIGTKLNEISSLSFDKERVNSEDHISKKLYNFLFNGLFTPLSASMFSLLSVYIASAAFRAFRIRSFEAFLMMITAVIVMLGQTSFGTQIYSEMPAIRQWLMEVPNSAAFRAIKIGASVAGLVMAIRVWLSIDKA